MFYGKSYPELQIYPACSSSFIPTPHGGKWACGVRFVLTLALLLVYREDEDIVIVDE